MPDKQYLDSTKEGQWLDPLALLYVYKAFTYHPAGVGVGGSSRNPSRSFSTQS
jgi:hypothetical protein